MAGPAQRKQWVFSLTKTAGRVLLYPFFNMCREGVENLPEHGPFVLLPKHQRWEDVPLLGIATPRPIYYVAKVELFANPVGNWYMRSLGGIPLNRGRPLESRSSIRTLREVLQRECGVVVFPEGTYYRDRMGPGRSGMVRMILSGKRLPFVPVGIRYTAGAGRTGVVIRFGKAFEGDAAVDAEDFTSRVMDEIARLSGLDRNSEASSGVLQGRG
jgi:1-acyl-sn-glycerol-3-phosphate acyltransferase